MTDADPRLAPTRADAGFPPADRPFRRFFRLLAKDKKDIGLVYLYAVVNGIVALSLPLGIQAIVGLILAGRVSTSWVILTVIVTLGVAFSGVLQIVQLSITEVLQQRIFTRASFEFAYRIPRIKTEAIRGVYLPELVNRFFDTLNVQKGLSKILLDLSTSALQIILGLALLALYHPFFIFFGLALMLTLAALIRWSLHPGLRSSLKESTYKYRVAHWLKELARGFSTFKLAGETVLPLDKTDTLVSSYLTHRKQHFRILVFQYAGVVLFKTLITLGLLALGGILVMRNEITIGQFVASEIIIILVMTSAEKLILTMEPLYDVLTAVEKMGQVTDLPLDPKRNGPTQEALTGTPGGLDIDLRDVSLGQGNFVKRPVLANVDLRIPAGARVALVGPEGSGKTALLELLGGFVEPVRGSRLIHGVPAKNIDPQQLRRQIGDALDREILFEGSLRDNLTVGREDISQAALQGALETVGLDAFVQATPLGLETPVNSDGEGLNHRVLRRLYLARAIAGAPRMVLIDNFLESFGGSARRDLIDAFTRDDAPWTLVAACNDPDFLARCTHIVQLDEGRIVEVLVQQPESPNA